VEYRSVSLKGNVYKANVDATIDGGTRRGCGLIIQDSKGERILAACTKVEANWDIETSKGFAVYQGLRIALETGIFELVMKSDALAGHPSNGREQEKNLSKSFYRRRT